MDPPRPKGQPGASGASSEDGAGPGPSSQAAMRGAAAKPASLLDALDPLLGSGALGLEERRALRQACCATRLAVDGALCCLDLQALRKAMVLAPHDRLPELRRFMARMRGLRELRAPASALPMYLGFLETGGAGGGVAAGLRKVHLRLRAGGKVGRELSQALHDACPRLKVR
jgi:hypothetical protein